MTIPDQGMNLAANPDGILEISETFLVPIYRVPDGTKLNCCRLNLAANALALSSPAREAMLIYAAGTPLGPQMVDREHPLASVSETLRRCLSAEGSGGSLIKEPRDEEAHVFPR
jgi:hypothetical protein